MSEKIEKPKRLNIPHQEQKVVIKIMLVGYHSIGKTALACKLSKCLAPNQPTLGADYYDIHIDQKSTIFHLNFFDFSGKDTYLQIRNEFYRDSHVLLLIFDLNYKRTFEELEGWLNEAKDYGFQGIKIVVGNKSDQIRVLPIEHTKGWATQKGCQYCQTSALDNKGVEDLRELLIKSSK